MRHMGGQMGTYWMEKRHSLILGGLGRLEKMKTACKYQRSRASADEGGECPGLRAQPSYGPEAEGSRSGPGGAVGQVRGRLVNERL